MVLNQNSSDFFMEVSDISEVAKANKGGNL